MKKYRLDVFGNDIFRHKLCDCKQSLIVIDQREIKSKIRCSSNQTLPDKYRYRTDKIYMLIYTANVINSNEIVFGIKGPKHKRVLRSFPELGLWSSIEKG